MPHKKRSHAHHKKSQGSQPRQYSPTSVAQVAVNPAQFESASAASTMATKPGAMSVTMGGATASGATAGGSPTTAGTTQRGTAKVAMPEPAPMHPAKATPPTTGGGIIVVEAATPWKAEVPTLQESLKQTAKSVPTTSSKVDMAKKDPAKLVTAVAAPAAAAGDASLKGPQTKVQVEVVPPGAKAAKEELAVDPFDALADSLPSSESFAPAAHVYTGPEVIEHGLTSKKGVICGGDDCPLPPGYRFEDMAPVADVKPKDVPKPMSTDEALDSLSFGFTTSMAPIPQKQEKKVEDLGAIDALSAGFSNFAPPPPAPIKKAEEFKSAPVTKCPAPPTDKKAKVEKFADDFSLMSGLDSPLDTKPKTAESVPTTSSKVDMAKKDPAKLVTAVAAPAAAAGDASLKGPQTKKVEDLVAIDASSAGFSNFAPPPPAPIKKSEEFKSAPVTKCPAPPTDKKAKVEKLADDFSLMSGLDSPLDTKLKTAESVPTTSSKVDMAKKDPAKLVTAVAAPAAAAGDASLKGPQTKKVEDLVAIDASSAGFSNFAPPPPAPIKKSEEFKSAPVTKCPAPPTDKKAKVEKLADDFSLMSGLDSPLDTKLKTAESVPTTSSKVDMAKKDPAKLVTAVAAPAAAAGDASLKGPQTKVQVEVVPPGAKAAKEPAPMHPAKATPPTTGGGIIVVEAATPWKAEVPTLQESLKQTAKSVPTTSSKVDMAKKDPAKLVTAVAAPAAAAGDASLKGPQTKVQVEVVPPGAKAAKEELAVDPFDALADSLPSSESFAPAAHVYTGPEVIEHGLTSKKGVICGGDDCPLPPGYRFEDMAPVADVKPKDVPKPMSTDEALDSLSFGFTTSMAPIPQKQEKKVEDLGAIDALSAGFSNFAPPPPAPIKKAEEFKSAPVTKCPAPPTDKKAKVEKFADDFSLMSGLDSPLDTKPKTAESVPTTSSKVDMAKKDPAKLVTAVAAPAAAAGDASLKGPQTKKVEDLVAIDASSAGFSNFAPPPPAPIKKAEEFKSAPVTKCPAPPTDKKAKVEKLADDFSLMSGLDSPLDTKPKTAESVPTTSSKVDMAKKDPAKLVTAVAAPAAAAGDASLKGPQTKVQVEVVPPGAKAAKEPAPMHPAKATPPTTGGGIIVVEAATPWKAEVPTLQESLKQTAKSVPTTSSKVDMAKKDPAKLVTAVAAPAAAAGDASLKGPQTKLQVEVDPPGAKAAKEELAVDPFDALADSLPSSDSFAPAAHVYTGPEVIEHGLTSKKGVICGGDDCPLPPGYRFEDMAPVADVKPKDVPKPMSTDEALDSLSFGFITSMAPIPQKQEKKVEDLGAIDALSAGFSNFAPPPPAPIKKSEEFKSAPVTKCPAPTTDKKAKVEKLADDFSLMSGLDSPLDTKPKTAESVPTTSSKVDMAKKDPAKLVTAVAAPAAAAGDASLKGPQTKVQVEVVPPGAKAAKEPAPMHPAKATPPTTGGGIIVVEAATPWKAEVPTLQESLKQTAKSVPTTSSKVDMAKKDPAKLVTAVAAPAAAAGDASLKGPQTKKVEDFGAIDASSAGFSNFAPPPPAPIKKSEEFKSAPVTKCPAPPIDKKAKVEKLADDFSLMSGLDSPLDTKPKTDEGGSMSLDALSALGDSLPAPEPAPQPPKISHEDIVTEGKLTSKKGVFVGERDDTLPPKYRFTENKVKDLPPLKPEAMAEAKVQAVVRPKQPSMDDSEALDLLSRDLSSSAGPAAASVAVTTEQRQPRLEPMSAPVLDDLAGTLLPDAPEFKYKGDKPKSKSRSKSKKQREEDPSSIDHLSGQLSSDVVSASTNKGGKS
ncbi:calpastatin isoform X7 [Salmo trutta]|uniref:calpastatin isoform X7 n=1 Tax=Salmo trutta TaxID=8032 RepID=UPI001131C834|nr:flocculation protein FLO11-like isoform X7 [Salmo trutta]